MRRIAASCFSHDHASWPPVCERSPGATRPPGQTPTPRRQRAGGSQLPPSLPTSLSMFPPTSSFVYPPTATLSHPQARLQRMVLGTKARLQRRTLLADQRFAHLAFCAAAPSSVEADGNDPSRDKQAARVVVSSLASLAAICGEAAVDRESLGVHQGEVGKEDGEEEVAVRYALECAARELARRAEGLSSCGRLLESDAVSARWSILREPPAPNPLYCPTHDLPVWFDRWASLCSHEAGLLGRGESIPQLEAQVSHLPFDLLPALVVFPHIAPSEEGHDEAQSLMLSVSVEELRREIKFEQQASTKTVRLAGVRSMTIPQSTINTPREHTIAAPKK